MSHPALVLAVLWVAVLSIDYLRRRVGWSSDSLGQVFLVTFGLAFVAAYIAVVIWYASQMTYFDPAEPTITSVASVFGAGRPLYPALDDPERYAHVYGPALFIIQAAAMAVFGSSILVSKAVGAIAILVSLAVGFHVFRERAGLYAATLATAACVLVYMLFSNVTFWTRSDPLLILCVTLSLLATRLRGRVASMVLLGLTLGVVVNLKVTGVLYLLPAVAIALSAHGPRPLVLAATVAGVTAVAPFLLPNVSLLHYKDYLALSARNGFAAGRMRQNLEWVIFLSAPVAAVLWSTRTYDGQREHTRPLLMALVPAVIVVAIVSSKPGGGPFHLLPFVPILAYVVLCAPPPAWKPAAQTLALAFVITVVALAVPKQLILVGTIVGRDLGPAVWYIRGFADAHPGKRIAVGYSGTSILSFARPEAVFRTHDYLLDAPAIQEHRLSGLPLPESTVRALVTCRIEYMLIPSAGSPFAVPSAYSPDGPKDVFPQEFRSEFFRRYRRITISNVFDVWQCVK